MYGSWVRIPAGSLVKNQKSPKPLKRNCLSGFFIFLPPNKIKKSQCLGELFGEQFLSLRLLTEFCNTLICNDLNETNQFKLNQKTGKSKIIRLTKNTKSNEKESNLLNSFLAVHSTHKK